MLFVINNGFRVTAPLFQVHFFLCSPAEAFLPCTPSSALTMTLPTACLWVSSSPFWSTRVPFPEGSNYYLRSHATPSALTSQALCRQAFPTASGHLHRTPNTLEAAFLFSSTTPCPRPCSKASTDPTNSQVPQLYHLQVCLKVTFVPASQSQLLPNPAYCSSKIALFSSAPSSTPPPFLARSRGLRLGFQVLPKYP